jgi:hypothetical protein
LPHSIPADFIGEGKMTVYQKGQQWEPGEFPAILAVGDSWFWYPKNNLLEALSRHPRLLHDFRHI